MQTSLQKIKQRQDEIKRSTLPQPSAFDMALGFAQLSQLSEELKKLRDEYTQLLGEKENQFETLIGEKMNEIDVVLQKLSSIDFTGESGPMPVAGIDFPIPENGKDGVSPDKNEIVKEVLKNIRQPKDGETPIVDEEKIVKKVLAKIPKIEVPKAQKVDPQDIIDKVFELLDNGKKKLSTKHIGDFTNGLEQTIAPIRSLAAGFRGGGDTVEAGTGVSITVVNGKKVISSGSTITFIDDEVVSGSGTSWTLANTPVVGSVKLFALGQKLVLTTDYSITGTAITTVSSWDAGSLVADYRTS